ncbi:MAG: glycosyltransferase [Bacteroidales bacterium]|nr:glycosyltransferase [Bacteroidales bacterium]
MRSRLNILVLASWFPNRTNVTLGNFVVSHLKAMALYNNVQVLFVAKDLNASNDSNIETYTIGENIKVNVLYFKESKSRCKLLNNLVNNFRYITTYLKGLRLIDFPIDIVHLNVVYPVGLLAVYLKWKKKLPYVITEHWTIYQAQNRHKIKGLKGYIFRLTAKHSEVIMPVSNQLGKMMQECGLNSNYKTVPNTLDVDVFNTGEKEKTEIFKWIHISTLVDEMKNVSGILRSFKMLLDIDKKNHLTVVSDGNIEQYRSLVAELNIPNDKILFIGTQTAKQIADWMRASHAFVLFSNFENLPLVIIESFSTGTPVIATDVGGIKEHFPDYSGIIIPRKDEKALLNAMVALKQNYSKFDLKKTSQYARANFSYSAVGEAFNNIYHQIIQSKQ